MSKLLKIICEGKTEERLVNNLLVDRLLNMYDAIIPITLPTGKNPMGGNAKGGFHSTDGYAFALKHIINTIKMDKNCIFTTFFDLYKFPKDIECYLDAEKVYNPIEKANIYERQIAKDIFAKIGNSIVFLPNIQPYESEAFLFVNPMITAMEMADTDRNVEKYKNSIYKIRNDFITPEHINATKGPSKHLEEIFPNYKKNKVGKGGFSWRAAKEIGIDAICGECEHFRKWIAKLEGV